MSLQTCKPNKLPLLRIRHIPTVCEKMYKVEELTSKAYNLLAVAADPNSDKRIIPIILGIGSAIVAACVALKPVATVVSAIGTATMGKYNYLYANIRLSDFGMYFKNP